MQDRGTWRQLTSEGSSPMETNSEKEIGVAATLAGESDA